MPQPNKKSHRTQPRQAQACVGAAGRFSWGYWWRTTLAVGLVEDCSS